jgi:ABC-type Fe3+/spermidine/putrescine transport system ATPase subunit
MDKKVGISNSNIFQIECKGLRFSYEDREILHSVSLKVRPGERWGIMGASGSGKTTLLRSLAGELLPQSGEIFLEGLRVHSLRSHLIPGIKGVTIMKQDLALDPNITVDESIARRGRHLSDSALRRFLGRVHRHFDLQKVKHRPLRLVSGGQQQRTALAAAIIDEPKVLILDEPFSHLDYSQKHKIMDLLLDWNPELTLIMASHDPNDLMRFCTHVAVMQKGKIVQRGSSLSVYEKPKNDYVAEITGPSVILTTAQRELLGLSKNALRPDALLVQPDSEGPLVLKRFIFNAFYWLARVEIVGSNGPAFNVKLGEHKPNWPEGTRLALQ